MKTLIQKKLSKKQKVFYSCILSLLFVLVVPLIPYVIEAQADNINASESGNKINKPVALTHPAINLWNDVRQRNTNITGTTQVKGVESGILINKTGEDWRLFRMEKLVPYGAYFMGIVLSLIILFYLLHGKTALAEARSGKRVLRFTLNQRTAHWFTVVIFWLLGITGLILLYGRFVLIPVLGTEGFSVTASACKEMHNLLGPLFLLAVIAMLVLYVKDNFFTLVDLKWFVKLGGMFGGHASAGRFNAGEKTWFWLVMIFGFALCVSGLILDFAVFGQGRQVMALSHVIHGISAILLISVSFGHMYLGTLGVEGTLESMTTGYVDVSWAKTHHDLWYKEISGDENSPSTEARQANAAGDIGHSVNNPIKTGPAAGD